MGANCTCGGCDMEITFLEPAKMNKKNPTHKKIRAADDFLARFCDPDGKINITKLMTGFAELKRLLALHESQQCLPGCDSLAHDDKCPVVNPELAQQPPVSDEHCEWKLDNEYSLWNTECGEAWTFPEGGPRENGVKYCVACGRPVALQEEN